MNRSSTSHPPRFLRKVIDPSRAFLAILTAILTVIFVGGCDSPRSDAPPATPGSTSPTSQPEGSAGSPTPSSDRVTAMVEVEELTEQVANRLIEFSGAVWRRDYPAAHEYLDPTFQGTPLDDLPTGESVELVLGVREQRAADGFPASVAGDAFLASIESRFDRLAQIDRVFFKTRGAEFGLDRTTGTIRFTAQIIGRDPAGGMVAYYAWGTGAVRDGGEGRWRLTRLDLERAREQTAAAPLLVEVSRSAGIAHREPRFGDTANRSYYWRGAASEDVDGDGLYDIFVSSPTRSFLYRNRGDGRFDEIAADVGLADLAEVTTPLLLDIDGDGDLDFFGARVGWTRDGVPAGRSLVLRRNDGGRFVDITREAGLDQYVNAFSAIAFDHDRDGDLDIFVCGYGRLDAAYPNSWHRATNGQPNLLLRNLGGSRFEDIAASAGLAGSAWSYAAAAADYDEDGWIDLAVANDYGENALYRGKPDGTFEDVAAEAGVLDVGNGMGVAWADLDDDGRLDLYVSNMSSSAGNRILKRFADRSRSAAEEVLFKLAAGNSIFLQRGEGAEGTEGSAGFGSFERLDPAAGGIGASWAWGASLLDFDLDGDLDVYVANGFISGDSLKDT